MKCCGEDRDVSFRFCPRCGAALEQTPLLELLAHVRKVARSNRTAQKNAARKMEDRECEDYQTRLNESYSKVAGKWERWETALTEHLTKEQATTPT